MFEENEWDQSLSNIDRTEEIIKLTVAPDASVQERASASMDSGNAAAIEFVVERLPEILGGSSDEASLEILRRLSARNWDGQSGQIAFLNRLAAAAPSCTPAVIEWLLKLATSRLKPKQPDSLAVSWLEILVSLGAALNDHRDFLKKQILPIAMQKQPHISSTLLPRIVSSVLLCLCAQYLPEEDRILQKCLSCCLDIDAEIRTYMAGQIPALTKAWSHDAEALNDILTEAAELTTDEHLNVRKVAIVSLEICARGLPTGTAAGQLRAAVMSVVQKASRADWVNEMGLEAVLLPLLSIGMTSEADDATKRSLLACLRSLLGQETPGRREKSANIFPEVCRLYGLSRFQSELAGCVDVMVSDENEDVRAAAGQCIPVTAHGISRLNEAQQDRLKLQFLRLVKDRSTVVATSALESLQTLAKSFLTEDAVQRSQFTGLLLPVVAEIFRSQQLHWRLIFAALSAIPFLLQFLNKDEVIRELHGVVFTELACGTRPCKTKAAAALAAFFKCSLGGRQSGELYRRLVLDFRGNNESCWHQLGFLRFCEAALEDLDARFFKHHFWYPCLELGKDPVVDVRMALMELVPKLRAACDPKQDALLLTSLDQVLSNSRVRSGSEIEILQASAAATSALSLHSRVDPANSEKGHVDLLVYLPSERARLLQTKLARGLVLRNPLQRKNQAGSDKAALSPAAQQATQSQTTAVHAIASGAQRGATVAAGSCTSKFQSRQPSSAFTDVALAGADPQLRAAAPEQSSQVCQADSDSAEARRQGLERMIKDAANAVKAPATIKRSVSRQPSAVSTLSVAHQTRPAAVSRSSVAPPVPAARKPDRKT